MVRKSIAGRRRIGARRTRTHDIGPRKVLPSRAMRALTLWCRSGLTNRLKVWTSGQVIAAASGRAVEMLWPLTEDCGAGFGRIFVADPRVRDVTRADVEGLPLWEGEAPRPDFVRGEHDVIGSYNWLLSPGRHPGHARLFAEAGRRLGSMRLAPALEARVTELARAFRPRMIGVHLRRGDFHTFHPGSVATNTTEALWLVRRRLDRMPDAGIFLATDDGAARTVGGAPIAPEGVLDRFREAFGDRVVSSASRHLDRLDPASIEDAAVDLWLLRKTDAVVGTRGSSFSELAAFGRDVPFFWAGGSGARIAYFERLARRTGTYPLIIAAARWDLGRAPESFHEAWLRVRTTPLAGGVLRALRRLRQGLAS